MFTYMGHNNEMSSITMFPSVFIEEHQQPEQLFIEMETTRRVQEINKKSFCCSSSTNSIVAAAAAAAEEALNPNSSVVGVGNGNGNGNGNGGSCNTKKPKTSRKRSGKKDRHSKIVTAQGSRDRRMRLSLDIARRFFSLQDMLGFDKASKTVEWLLSKSKHAVKELTRNHCLPDAGNYEDKGGGKSMEDMMVMKRAKKKKKMITAGTCMMTTSSVLSQGEGLVVDREESRARARERTVEKTMVPKSNQFTNKQGSMGSASSFEIEDDQHCPSSSTNQINKSEDNINNKSIPNFTENWVIDHVTTIPSSSYGNGTHLMHQHLSTTAGNIHEQAVPSSIFTTSSDLCLQSQFPDTQLYAKLWEHYYTHSNLC